MHESGCKVTQTLNVIQLRTTASEIISSDIVWTDLFLVEKVSALQVSYEMLLLKYKDLLCVDYEKAKKLTRNAYLEHFSHKSKLGKDTGYLHKYPI